MKTILVLLSVLLTGSLAAQAKRTNPPGRSASPQSNRISQQPNPNTATSSTQTFRDSHGRVTGTATTTTTPSGSSATTYQTGSGKPVVSSTGFNKEEGKTSTVQKNVYPKDKPATKSEDVKTTTTDEKK